MFFNQLTCDSLYRPSDCSRHLFHLQSLIGVMSRTVAPQLSYMLFWFIIPEFLMQINRCAFTDISKTVCTVPWKMVEDDTLHDSFLPVLPPVSPSKTLGDGTLGKGCAHYRSTKCTKTWIQIKKSHNLLLVVYLSYTNTPKSVFGTPLTLRIVGSTTMCPRSRISGITCFSYHNPDLDILNKTTGNILKRRPKPSKSPSGSILLFRRGMETLIFLTAGGDLPIKQK